MHIYEFGILKPAIVFRVHYMRFSLIEIQFIWPIDVAMCRLAQKTDGIAKFKKKLKLIFLVTIFVT